jgi:hypothetical protein
MSNDKQNSMSRREFLRRIGIGAGSAMALMAIDPINVLAQDKKTSKEQGGKADVQPELPTAISTVEADDAEDVYYDLSGRRLEGKPDTKGVYIKDGKKVVF